MLLINAYKLFLVDREVYCAEKTIIFYKENVYKFIVYAADYLSIDTDLIDCAAIDRAIVQAYISSLRLRCKNTTVNTYFRAVKVFLNYCIDEEYCTPDILRKIKFLKDDSSPVVPLRQWEVEEIDDLYSDRTESGLRNLCIIHLMLDAGFRCSDVCNLMYSNIDFDNNFITVKGKGDKYRTVIMCKKLKKMLYHYLLKYRPVSDEEDYPVFVQIGSSEPICSNVIKQLFSRIKNNSGISRVHPHLLRHTFATSYILGGGNMEFLRMMMGHSDYETTKIYLHLAQEAKMLNADIYKLDPVFFKSVY